MRFTATTKTRAMLVAVLSLAGPAIAAPVVIDGIAAYVNDRVVLISDVNRVIAPLYAKLRQTYTGDEVNVRIMEAYKEALDMLTERQLILSHYELPNPDAVDALVDDQMDELVRTKFDGDRSEFMDALAEDRVTLEEWRGEMRDRIIISLIQRREVGDKIVVSPGAVRMEYEKSKDAYTSTEKVKLRMIVLRKDARAKPEIKRAQAESVRKLAFEGSDYAKLANDFSEDVRREQGGDWGWVAYDELRDELAKAVSETGSGEISDVIELDDAFYILKVEGRRDAVARLLRDVSEQIELELRKQEYNRLYSEWMERLHERSYVRIRQ